MTKEECKQDILLKVREWLRSNINVAEIDINDIGVSFNKYLQRFEIIYPKVR